MASCIRVVGSISQVLPIKKTDRLTGQVKYNIRLSVQSSSETIQVGASIEDFKASPVAVGTRYMIPVSVLPSRNPGGAPLYWWERGGRAVEIPETVELSSDEEIVSIADILSAPGAVDPDIAIRDMVSALAAPKQGEPFPLETPSAPSPNGSAGGTKQTASAVPSGAGKQA